MKRINTLLDQAAKILAVFIIGAITAFATLNTSQPVKASNLPTAQQTPTKQALEQLAEQSAIARQIPPEFLKAIVTKENKPWNPDAMNTNNKRLPSRSQTGWDVSDHGLAQVNGSTARHYGLDDLKRLYDPKLNLELASMVIQDCKKQAASKSKTKLELYLKTATCYHRGNVNVNDSESRAYSHEVLGLYLEAVS